MTHRSIPALRDMAKFAHARIESELRTIDECVAAIRREQDDLRAFWLETKRVRIARPGSVRRYASRVRPRTVLAVRRYIIKHPAANYGDVRERFKVGNNREISYIMSGRRTKQGIVPMYDAKGMVIP